MIAVAASLPLAWNAEPTFPPWLLTPETTCPPWDLTFPDVSPETLDATFALPSAAASFAPPPPPDWPWTDEAAESIVPLTFWPEAVTADLPWLAKSAPVCVAALAASSTALLVLVVAEPFQVVTWPLAVAPAAVTLPFAPAIAAVTWPLARVNAPRTAPMCVVPASDTSRWCLPTVCAIAWLVRCWACLSRCASACVDSAIAALTCLRPSLIDRLRSRSASRASAADSLICAAV